MKPNEIINEACDLLYKAQLKLAAILEQKPPSSPKLDHWCVALQDLMDEMEQFVSHDYSPFGKDARTTNLTEQDVELLNKK